MAKFGMYTKGTNESSQQINVVEMSNQQQAEAYFAGVKRLSIDQFRNLFIVREINQSNQSKNLLLG
jgi:hypothetical protein